MIEVTTLQRWPATGEAQIVAFASTLYPVEIRAVPLNAESKKIATRKNGDENVVYLDPEGLDALFYYAEHAGLRVRQLGLEAPGVYVLWTAPPARSTVAPPVRRRAPEQEEALSAVEKTIVEKTLVSARDSAA